MFQLDPVFISTFDPSPTLGFNDLGKFIFNTKYSRKKENGTKETWRDTIERVVNGTFRMQEEHIIGHGLPWSPEHAQVTAQEMFQRMYTMKFLPPGRGLWIMGSPATHLGAALNNCAFISTVDLSDAKPFTFLMDMSMVGVGVGFDTKGAGTLVLHHITGRVPTYNYVVEDTREGWVLSTKMLILAGFGADTVPTFDYSKIRVKGTPLQTFGGIASGSDPLRVLHESLTSLFDRRAGAPISATDIVDIMNLIGRCVVSGNIRRTAEIAFGPPSDEFMDLKDFHKNPARMDYGWTSNNSVMVDIGHDYSKIAERVRGNGEPGVMWLENAQKYSRMASEPDWKDVRVQGTNPCGEQTLENFELCCLVETFPNHHETREDFIKTLKVAYLYAKTVTLAKTHWAETNAVIAKNRRIGCSISGIAQFLGKRSIEELRSFLVHGYRSLTTFDIRFSDWLGIPRSIKMTSVKPSGTVSLIAGATPGMHYPESKTYIRRVRLSATSEYVAEYVASGYDVEQDVVDASSVVVSFPIDVGDVRPASKVSMWEQLNLAAFLQEVWADNSVSCTITFNPEEACQIEHALNYAQYRMKSVSFLPRLKVGGAYKQMPYEAISQETYHEMVSRIRKPITVSVGHVPDAIPDMFCENDACLL